MNTISFTKGVAAKFFTATALFSLIAGMLPMQAFAEPKPDVPKVEICHATSADANPYNSANADQTADAGGHDGHNPDNVVWFPGITTSWGDIIPPFQHDDINYLGKNWSTEGQAIWNNGCKIPTLPAPEATLTLVKNVSGGSASASSWTLSASGPTPISGVSGASSVTNAKVSPGTYSLSESGTVANYTNGTTFSCVKNGGTAVSSNSITLADKDTATCTITNTYVPPVTTGTITIQKTVVNDNGGTATAGSFTFRFDGNTVALNTPVTVSAGSHTVSEDAFANYTAGSWGGACAADGSITVAANQNYTCTITNNDDQVVTPTGTLKVEKVIVGNPSAVAADFSYALNTNPAVAFETAGTNYTLAAGSAYSVTEITDAKYTTAVIGCSGTIAENQTSTCTITNTWIPTCDDKMQNGDETGVDTGGSCGGGNNDMLGCTDKTAQNYDPNATKDDGGCVKYASQCTATPANLLVNGSFEDPAVTHPDMWDIFPFITGWVSTNGIEIWKGILNGPSVGLQNAELDTTGPTKITQSVTTISGATYELRFDFAARSGVDNAIEATADTNVIKNVGTTNTSWVTYGGTFVAADSSTDISFEDKGANPDSLGTLLDNAVLCLVREPGDTEPDTYKIQGYVWHDDNENQLWDGVNTEEQGDEEAPLAGWAVSITNGETTLSTTTDATGYYYFAVPAGTWTITETVQGGWGLTTQQSHVVTVPAPSEMTFLDSVVNAIIPTAFAAVVGKPYGDYNFGNDQITTGGGGGGRVKRTPDGEVLGEATSTPQVLGDQVEAVPYGAPNAGAGATSPFALNYFSVVPVAFFRRTKVHG